MGKLMDFKKGSAIMTGDFCLEPGIDSTSWVQGNRNVQLKIIKNKYQCQMLDIWRVQHPKTQDCAPCAPNILNVSNVYW